jgi:hypothetical protein
LLLMKKTLTALLLALVANTCFAAAAAPIPAPPAVPTNGYILLDHRTAQQ